MQLTSIRLTILLMCLLRCGTIVAQVEKGKPGFFDNQVVEAPRFAAEYQYQLEFDNETESQVEFSLSKLPFRERLNEWGAEFGSDFITDQQNFYSARNFQLLAGAFVIGATVANTSMDDELREVFENNLTLVATDEYSEFFHNGGLMGDGYLVLPAYLAIAVVGKGLSNDPIANLAGEWSERNIRAMLAGAPALLLSQNLTGASRPGESSRASDWRPFQDDNGVSGHSFMGAIPFLTAARMSKNPWAKAGFYTASTIPGISRITDGRHYPSQVFLGWTLAYVATSSVAQTEFGGKNVEFAPMLVGNDLGFGVTFRR